jgi:hypothetical protein
MIQKRRKNKTGDTQKLRGGSAIEAFKATTLGMSGTRWLRSGKRGENWAVGSA